MEVITPNKLNIFLQPGHVAVHNRLLSSNVCRDLKDYFNAVKMKDLGDVDIYLPNTKILYIPESQLVISSDVDSNKLKSIHPTLVIADRNTVTVDAYSELQDSLTELGIPLFPVGHAGEVALLVHMISLTHSVQSPTSNFRQANKPKDDIQIQLLLCVPTLGRAKAKKLLNVYGTVQSIAHTSLQDMVQHVGLKTASQVHKYFNGLVST